MERIRKALERAGQERALLGGESRPVVPTQPVPDLSTGVRYTMTKMVEVAPSTFLKNRLISALPEHKNRESYRMLRTRVLQSMRNNGWTSVAVTGPASGCGKSLTAINLAISLAAEVTHTVLLVDLDLRNPSVHRYFDYQPQKGLSDFLREDIKLYETLFTPGIERLVVLPGREVVPNSAEMLRSPRMVSLVNELKTRYPDRLVVFDLPPILAADDALAFAPYTDCVLMVAETGNTRKEDLQKSYDLLKGTPLVGTVLNRSDTQSAGYGYGPGGPETKQSFWQKLTNKSATENA
jgi:protein-tyrosine kinase